jgi:type IV secretory pathway VirB10-like protein
MLPDIRAVVAAVFAVIALLAVSFGLAATFRVAQESRTGSLQADLAQRSRMFVPASSEQRTVLLIDTPAPLEPIPVAAVEVRQAPDIPPVEVAVAPQAEPAPPPEPAARPPAAEPPMGGPLEVVAARSEEPVDLATEHAAEKEKAKKAAAKKVRAARERIARQRKAAARRAAEARAKQQAGSSSNAFGNSFGGFGDQTFRQ